MSIQWKVTQKDPKRLKEFLKDKHISRRIIGRTKFHGGLFLVNNKEVRVREELFVGDTVELILPIEEANSNLKNINKPLDILYEDEYYLIINKPVGLRSVPSPAHRGDTVAGRVKNYYQQNNYRHQVVHIVTRLDRYTSGVLLIAKNTLAHSLMGRLLDEQKLEKYYEAIVEGHLKKEKDLIDAPIARASNSIIERVVHPKGKPSLTEYNVLKYLKNKQTFIRLSLYTGRTHQIRVHMSHLGHPLAGDDLYGGSLNLITRQALHCSQYVFIHPLTDKKISVCAPLPMDMKQLLT